MSPTEVLAAPTRASRRSRDRRASAWTGGAGAVAAVTGWFALVAGAHVWGEHLLDAGHRMKLPLPPLFARFDPRPGPGMIPAAVVAVAAVAAGPRLAARLAWRRLLVMSGVGAGAWAVALALVDGVNGLTAPVLSRFEYLAEVPSVGSPREFLATFTERLADYRIHVQGHPPGTVLLLWALERVGLGGAGWAAGLFIAGGAVAVPAALVTIRAVAGEAPARRAAPFLVVVPAAVWMATSADALYAGVAATGVALLASAARRPARAGDALAVAGGVVLGVAAHLSYGLVVLAPLAVLVCAVERRVRPLAVALAGALSVTAAFTAAGFWWFDGLSATHERYWAGVASQRPYGYFVVANLAAFAVAIGPASAAGLARLPARRRDSRLWVVVAGGLAAVALADLSGMSKAEVERIWLPFVPWVVAATAALTPPRHGGARRWLALQAAVAVVLQVTVWTPW